MKRPSTKIKKIILYRVFSLRFTDIDNIIKNPKINRKIAYLLI